MATSFSLRAQRYFVQEFPANRLGILRALFGAMMVVSCVRFIALGWIDEQYIKPVLHFPYLGFEWVTTLGSPGMEILFGVMLASAIGVMLGAWYRVSALLLFLTFTYIELIDKTYYLNHYYFVSITAFLFCLLPAHSSFSIDAKRNESLKKEFVPRWMLDVFRLQIAIVYIHAGLAKINYAWLIDAMPLRLWMPAQDTLPLVGWLMIIPWMPWVFSWMGMLFDVSVPFFLNNRRTRPFAYLAVLGFHITTGLMFQIGVFPLVMIALTTVFFLTDKKYIHIPEEHEHGVALLSTPTRWFRPYRFTLSILAVHFALQVLIPWRYLLYPGDLFWTEEGYRFGWRVMLMEKAGTAQFTVEDSRTHRKGIVANCDFLNEHQEKQMAMQPDMIVQYAHFLHDHYEKQGVADPIVRAEAWVTLNGKRSKLIVDPHRDLSQVQLDLGAADWILRYD